MLKLVGTDGKQFYSWSLGPGKYVIGRRSECDFCIPHGTVSRKHAEIQVHSDDRRCVLIDLGSHNGTVVNGSRITSPIEVKEGDNVMFGHTEFRITTADDPSGMPVTGPTETRLSDRDPENSVFLSIDDLKPLTSKATQRPDVLTTLSEMAKVRVLPEPKEQMLKKSLETISMSITAERLAVLFVPDNTDEVYTAASLIRGGKDPGAFRLSRTIINQIMTKKTAILIRDVSQDPRFAEQKSIIMSELHSAIAVPLIDEDRKLGILYADTSNPMHSYGDEDLRVLALFGNVVASRLLNYQLLSERESKQIMEAELKRASMIQEALLVPKPPIIAGYDICPRLEQSRLAGGDLYDMHRFDDGRLFFMVADVSGKGMGAALLMSHILASFRILYEAREFDLVRAVQRVSSQMFRHSDPSDFATLFAGILDPTTHEVRFVNAGHNAPRLVRNDGDITLLEPSGLVIGSFDQGNWQESVARMSQGDTLYIFTDGVCEAEHEDRFYGYERMEKLLVENRRKSAVEISQCIMDDVAQYMGDAPRSDDITMLTIKRTVT